ncbi:MAG: TetR/AcrR family transcriptional regulator [Caulobacterales bacterium]
MARTSQDTRERILEAAEAALETQSSRNIQLRDIAAQVGVSASLIVQYFGGKDELVFEASLRRMARNSDDQIANLTTLQLDHMSFDAMINIMLERDFRHAHVGRDLLSQSWWWSKRHEQRFQDVLAPRVALIQKVLSAYVGAPVDTDLSVELRVLTDIYYAALREAWIYEHGVPETSAALTPRMALIVEPLRARYPAAPERR